MSDGGQLTGQMWKPGTGWLVAVLAIVLLLAGGITGGSRDAERTEYRLDFVSGSLFVSDAGESHGGFEFTADYGVSIVSPRSVTVLSGDEVTMELVLDTGLADPLSAHEFKIRITYDPLADEMCLSLAKTTIRLVHVHEDTVWNHEFDGYYIASWGGYAPTEELRGHIGPSVFGLPGHYYVELRLDVVTIPVR